MDQYARVPDGAEKSYARAEVSEVRTGKSSQEGAWLFDVLREDCNVSGSQFFMQVRADGVAEFLGNRSVIEVVEQSESGLLVQRTGSVAAMLYR